MNSNDVNSIIDNLASKFGVASQYLITEISRYKIARGIAFIIVFLILAIISGFIAYITRQKWKQNEKTWEEEREKYPDPYEYCFDAEPYICPLGFFTALCIIFTVVIFINIVDVAGYIGSPTGAVVSDILWQLQGQ